MDRPSVSPAAKPAVALATVFGIGYAPWAPGTFGSLPGLLLYAAAYHWGGTAAVLAGIAVLLLAGIWASTQAEKHFGAKDPGKVVIDEVVGQMTALLFIAPTALLLAAGFVLFRVFDILKPFPVRRFEALPSGSGIMADDLVAGLYANLVLHGLIRLFPGWLS